MGLIKLLIITMLIFGIIRLLFVRKPETWSQLSNRVENWSNRKIMTGLFFVDLLAQGWLVFLRKYPIVADEVYSLSGSTFFAGYNWSSFMHNVKFYNFGYTMLLAPIYWFFSDFVVIYRTMLFCNIILQAIFIIITYYIVTTYFQCSKITGIAIALVSTCNAIILFFRGFVYNEAPLALCVWIVLLLLLKLINASGKMRFLFSAVLGIVSAYAYLIHSRCVIIYGTLAVVVLLYLVLYKKFLVQPISFGVTFAGMLFFEMKLIDYVRENLYLINKGEVMSNSVTSVVAGTSRYQALKSLNGIKKIIGHFFSLAGTTSIELGGILTILTVVVCYYYVKNRKKWRKGEEDPYRFVAIVYAMISFWGMVASIALIGASNGRVRFVVYVRYFMPFLGPLVMIGLVLLIKYKEFKVKWIAFWSVLLTLIVGVTFVFYAYPILKGVSLKNNASLYFFMAFSRYDGQGKFSKNIIIIALGLFVIFTGIMLCLYRKKQFISLCTVAMIFSVLLFWQVEMIQCSPSSNKRYDKSNGVHKLLQSAEIKDSTVCCMGSSSFKKAVLVSEYSEENILYYGDEFELVENTIMITDKKDRLEEFQPKCILKLDNNEWVGVWNLKTAEQLKKLYKVVE